MDIETIKNILQTQKEDIERELQQNIIPRLGLQFGKKALVQPNVLAVVGVRRCGKSIFSHLLANHLHSKVGYVNFFDERFIGVASKDLDTILQAMYELFGDVEILIFDEIQEIKGWERFISRLRNSKKIIITGSNAQLLQGELATYLTGRHLDFNLYPLSFKEIIGTTDKTITTTQKAEIRNKLEGYILGSGFPEYLKFGKMIIQTIYADIITKDCLIRYPIKEEEAFRKLAHYLVSNFSQECTFSKLSKIVGIKDVHTVRNYTRYLEEAFLVFFVERYSPKLKQQMIAPKKIFVVDHGIPNAVGFSISPDKGKIYENIVFIELLRRKTYQRKYYYFKDHQQYEVDFVIKEGNKITELIQVCFNIQDEKTKNREIRGLEKASKELACPTLTIITNNEEKKEKINGKTISYIPLWKWLLEK